MWRERRMEWGLLLVLFAPLLVHGIEEEAKFNGFIGCRFSKLVCQPYEDCIDDNLFGSCQFAGTPVDTYQYELERATLHTLEREIARLVGDGYTWTSLYTQCVVGNVLLASRLGIPHDSTWCDKGGAPPARYQEALSDDSKAILADYMNEYYSSQPPPENMDQDVVDVESFPGAYPEPPQKKDEFVNIHKYLANKRDESNSDETENGDYDRPEFGDFDEEYSENGQLDEPINSLVDELNPDDLSALKYYLQNLGQEEWKEELGEREGPLYEDGRVPVNDMEMVREEDGGSQQDADPGYMSGGRAYTEEDMVHPVFGDDDIDGSEAVESQSEPIDDTKHLALSPPDAKLLGDLLQDKVDVEALSDDQIQRLLNHVDDMLVNVEDNQDGENQMELASNNVISDKRAPIADLSQGPVGMDTADPTEGLPDPHDHSFNEDTVNSHTTAPKLALLNTLQGYMHVNPWINDYVSGQEFLDQVIEILDLPKGSLEANSVKNGDITFEVDKALGIDAASVAKQSMKQSALIQNRTHHTLEDAGVGDDTDRLSITAQAADGGNGPKYFVLTFVLCGCIAGIVLAVIALYVVRRHSHSKRKLQQLAGDGDGTEASKDYQDLCRQRMQSKTSEKPEPVHTGATRVSSVASEQAVRSPSSRSSTSSWSEEPVASNMDISTGHIVLSYMEDHLKNKDRLDEEWEALCAYEAEPSTTIVGSEASNMRKNRYSDVLPYDHSRVILSSTPNVSGSDYINANTITDHDPRNPAYIATQGPLPHTVADFWQMVWEQGSVVIVQLTKLTENGVAMCHRYWPEEGSDLYHIYEVHLVSEHIWCDDYLVRSFYLKNLQTNETRTVTQFHFLTWPDLGVPSSAKALLEFRRKVNKSYRGRSCPIVVHCSDGVGRTGTYCLVDMVLNRMSKGAKEIDIAATLEHIRDQRANMVKTKEQFEFALASVAEEVHAILKALPQ